MKKILSTLAILLCSGCTSVDVYVKNDPPSDGLLNDPIAIHNQIGTSQDILILKTRFYSNGELESDPSKLLYDKISGYILKKNLWQVTASNPKNYGRVGVEYMGVTIKDTYDVSFGERASYFFSGMSLGFYKKHDPTDNYEIEVTYIDKNGLTHRYNSQSHLITATGNNIIGNGKDSDPLKNLKGYNNTNDAFSNLLEVSMKGERKGVVSVGNIQAVNQPIKMNNPSSSNQVQVINTTANASNNVVIIK